MRRVKRKQQEVCDVDLNLDDCDLVGKLRELQRDSGELKIRVSLANDKLDSVYKLCSFILVETGIVDVGTMLKRFIHTDVSISRCINALSVSELKDITNCLEVYADSKELITRNNDEILMIKNKLGIK